MIFSGALHVMLLGILLFGSAFFNSEPKAESPPLLTVFDLSNITDGKTTGGNPNVQVAPPTTHAQAQTTEPQKPVEPPRQKQVVHENVDPPEPPVKKVKSSDDAPKHPHKESLDPDELKLTKHHNSRPVKNSDQSDSQAKEREYAAAKAAAQQFRKEIQNLKGGLSTSTAVELPGPGGGGPLSAAYRDIVASTYDAAWSSPSDLDEENAKVTISVTIARNGRVVGRRISKPSHNAAMDRSVENLLDTVNFVAPFPEGSSDSERTFEIILTLRAKH